MTDEAPQPTGTIHRVAEAIRPVVSANVRFEHESNLDVFLAEVATAAVREMKKEES